MSFPVLKICCPDRAGLVKSVTEALAAHGANIVRNDEYVDRVQKQFFMRTAFENVGEKDFSALKEALGKTLPQDTVLSLALPRPKKIVILATKEFHCLGDLLLRHHFNELNATIAAVVSNHDYLKDLVTRFDVPFHHIPHEDVTREAHEKSLLKIIAEHDIDYIVLAKYMRILSPDFVAKFPQRMINIHHSFLPAFIGAKPYHQAHARGVKMIGATAHFVTNDLDEGPIIAQDVVQVDHTDDPSTMVKAGSEVETKTLAKALKYVFDDRVFVAGNKTVIF